MKNLLILTTLLLIGCMYPLLAQVPRLISFQGILTDSNGSTLADDTYQLTFRLYDAGTAGIELWKEVNNSVKVTKGIFSVQLGSITTLNLPFNDSYWLGIKVGDETELTPRTRLTSAPYSINARNVIGVNNIFPNIGNVGVGTLTPSAGLTIGTAPSDAFRTGSVYISATDSYFDSEQGLVFRSNGSNWNHRFTATDALNATDEVVGIYQSETTAGDVAADLGLPIAVFKNDGKVGIGTSVPTSTLEVNGTVTATSFVGDGSGLTNVGGLTGLTDASNTVLGVNAGASLNTGGNNTFVGVSAGQVNTDGNTNVYLGENAGNANQGSGNIFVGNSAGAGEANGNNLLYIETSGISTPLIYGEFDNDLVRINGNFDVTGNVGIGTASPVSRLEVSGSAASAGISARARNTDDTGWASIVLNNDNRAYWISIGGSNATVGANSLYVFDETAAAARLFINPSGHVGIGTNTAYGSSIFDILHPATSGFGGMYISTTGAGKPFYGYFTDAGTGAAAWTYLDGTDNDKWKVYNGGDRLTITSTGSVGIGTTNPGFLLEVNGTAGKPGGGSWSDSSDERLKTNINDLNGRDALNKIMQLRGVNYEWINPEEHEAGIKAGFIAQEIEMVFPDWITEIEPSGADRGLVENDKIKALHFPHDFNAYLVGAIQEQQVIIVSQQQEINDLKNALAEIQMNLDQLQEANSEVITSKDE